MASSQLTRELQLIQDILAQQTAWLEGAARANQTLVERMAEARQLAAETEAVDRSSPPQQSRQGSPHGGLSEPLLSPGYVAANGGTTPLREAKAWLVAPASARGTPSHVSSRGSPSGVSPFNGQGQQQHTPGTNTSSVLHHAAGRGDMLPGISPRGEVGVSITVAWYMCFRAGWSAWTCRSRVKRQVGEKGRTDLCNVATTNTFKTITFAMILLNVWWIALDTDFNDAPIQSEVWWPFHVIENVFLVFFCVEIFLRLLTYETTALALRDPWFAFDLALVLMMIWGAWLCSILTYIMGMAGFGGGDGMVHHAAVFRALRILRLFRLARVARILKAMPEVMVLGNGIVVATRSAFTTLCVLALIVAVFAIFFTVMLSGTPVGLGCFDNVPEAMNYLFVNGIFGNQVGLINQVSKAHWTFKVAILIYIFLAYFTVLNMLVGVMVDVIAKVSKKNQEDALRDEVKRKLMDSVFAATDSDGDNMVSKQEFLAIAHNPAVDAVFKDIDVDLQALVEVADEVYGSRDELSYTEFLQVVLRFRSDHQATVRDVVLLRRSLVAEMRRMEVRLEGDSISV